MVDLKKFKEAYILEFEDHLQNLNDNLLKLEKNIGDKNILDELMRSAHTIKSSSAVMEYKKTAFLTHVMEDVFDYARNNELNITPEITNTLFKIFDNLERSLKSIKRTNKEINLSPITNNLKKITGVATEGAGKSPRNNLGAPIIKKSKNIAGINKVYSKEDEYIRNIMPIEYIKVPVKRLDDLMDLMEELLINKMRLEQLESKDSKLEGIINDLSRLVSDIQYQVMQVRLVPVEQIFARFSRMVRDLAKKQNKKIEFIITGEDMELDRTIVDKLGEPLVHLLKNAVDHGIPKPNKLSKNKNEKYYIKLKALREKDRALIVVENNGNSVDFNKIKEAAIKRNIITKEECRLLKERQVYNLIFHPKLTTKKQVTETSGRGVGLSAVKNFAQQLGGRVVLKSPITGGGARFILELPLTLAIINALLVRAGNTVFAIPFISIEKSVTIDKNDIKSMADQDTAVIDGINIPLIKLNNIFNLKNTKNQNDSHEELIVVLIKRGKDKVGIIIDELMNEQEIIVKPLPSIFKSTKGFSGSTILGDGKIILILDVLNLLESSKKLVK